MALTQITPELAMSALSPSTAFRNISTSTKTSPYHDFQTKLSWKDSSLNMTNRVNSLSPSHRPTWRIDGCTSLGTQFYTNPTFFSPVFPMHIHTFITSPSEWPLDLRTLLKIDSAFLYRDSRINQFPIAQHVLRTLDYWSSNITEFQTMYEALPFGSRIVFENMEKDIKQIRIQIVRSHDLERQLMSATSLPSLFTKFPGVVLPPMLDVSQLHHIQQIHDSTAIVELIDSRTKAHTSPEFDKVKLVFKTLSDLPSYLYHELSILLTITPHSNIIPRPIHLVTKKVRFGSKVAVVGFTLQHCPKGSLRDILPKRRIQGSLLMPDQIKWAFQITQVMKHIQNKGPGWYCDLRLDNVLISDSDDVVLIDFEQRGVMPSFAAPEIRYLDYVLSLVDDSSLNGEIMAEYRILYEQHIGPIMEKKITNEYYGSAPWLCQVSSKRHAFQIYMLGRLLWCIFEGMSAPQVEIWMEYLHEPDVEFPIFKQTPMELRHLIERCTQGWTRGFNPVKRKGRWLVRINDEKEREEDFSINALTKEWADELERAKKFLKHRAQDQLSTETDTGRSRPPTLDDILEVLAIFQEQL